VKIDKINTIKTFIRHGHTSFLFQEIKRRIYSDDISLGLRRNLNKDINWTRECSTSNIREPQSSDILSFLNVNKHRINAKEIKERLIRLAMYHSTIKTCYIVEISNSIPCHIIWVIDHKENEKMEAFFNGGFPPLKENELLVEGVYTPPTFRGKGIMVDVLSDFIKRSARDGKRHLLCFVKYRNMPSLKGFKRVGFEPYLIKKDRWRFFRRYVSFIQLEREYLEVWEKI